jgi:hypothetical protein
VRRDGTEVLRRTWFGEERAAARNPLAVVEALRRVVARAGDELAHEVSLAAGEPVSGFRTREGESLR